jgi:hypothetical protein
MAQVYRTRTGYQVNFYGTAIIYRLNKINMVIFRKITCLGNKFKPIFREIKTNF